MSGKLKETKKLREALKIAVEAVRPIREKIRTTTDRDRYDAWNEKRSGSGYRRHLHLALCYMNGTPYRKAEAKTCYDNERVPQYFRKMEWNALVRDVAKTLVRFECIQGKTEVDVQESVRAWIGKEPAVLTAARPERPSKLYVIVRADLSPGSQAVQAAHAMREFAAEHPDVEAEWHAKSNTVVMLSAVGEVHLDYLLAQAKLRSVEATGFREPDLANSLTAICVGPNGHKLPLRGLSLALQERAA